MKQIVPTLPKDLNDAQPLRRDGVMAVGQTFLYTCVLPMLWHLKKKMCLCKVEFTITVVLTTSPLPTIPFPHTLSTFSTPTSNSNFSFNLIACVRIKISSIHHISKWLKNNWYLFLEEAIQNVMLIVFAEGDQIKLILIAVRLKA